MELDWSYSLAYCVSSALNNRPIAIQAYVIILAFHQGFSFEIATPCHKDCLSEMCAFSMQKKTHVISFFCLSYINQLNLLILTMAWLLFLGCRASLGHKFPYFSGSVVSDRFYPISHSHRSSFPSLVHAIDTSDDV